MVENVYKRIKTIRIEKGMSQAELAEKCNVSKSLISKVESNKASIHLDLLSDVAQALEVSMHDLLEPYSENKNKASVVRKEEKKHLLAGVPGKLGYNYYRLAGSESVDALWLLVRSEAMKAQRYVAHQGFEFFYVIEGKIRLKFHDEEHILHEGDSAFFEGAHEHKILPHECDQARLVLLLIHR